MKKGRRIGLFIGGVLFGLVELLAVLAGGFGLLAALDAGALVMLTLTDLGQHTRLGTAALETLQSALQRLIFTNTNFRHLYFPPSGASGVSPYT